MPVLTVFAGPNGSGKSTVTGSWNMEPDTAILDSDAVARRRNPIDPSLAALEAGREVLGLTDQYIREERSFALETTLSGTWTGSAIRKAKTQGFFVRLVYICVKSSELNVQRVRERVAKGGHHVPTEDIRRRYVRSLSNLRQVVKMVDNAALYDNSEDRPRLVVHIESGVIVRKAINLPDWAKNLCDGLA